MNLKLGAQSNYHSASQLARVLTERWFLDNGYCPACPSEELEQTPNNEKVVDFVCPDCSAKYQLKAKSSHIGSSVANGAYQPKIDMIRAGTAPNWLFMEYDKKDLLVESVMLVPAHFVTPDIIQKRNPLKPTARRAGWVGSNVLIGKLTHREFIHDSQDDPRIKFIESLLKVLKDQGSIIVYSAPFETGRLEEIAEAFPRYRERIDRINARVWDQLLAFRNFYCDARFCGSNSLKKVLPVMVPELSYKTLDIQEGGTAMAEYARMISLPEGKEREKIKRNLLEYCKLDTLAMVEILNRLREI